MSRLLYNTKSTNFEHNNFTLENLKGIINNIESSEIHDKYKKIYSNMLNKLNYLNKRLNINKDLSADTLSLNTLSLDTLSLEADSSLDADLLYIIPLKTKIDNLKKKIINMKNYNNMKNNTYLPIDLRYNNRIIKSMVLKHKVFSLLLRLIELEIEWIIGLIKKKQHRYDLKVDMHNTIKNIKKYKLIIIQHRQSKETTSL